MKKEGPFLKENLENAEEIRKRINEEIDYETKEILDRARSQVSRLLKEAQLKADSEKQNALSVLDKQIAATKEKIFSALNLEKKKIILGEKAKFIDEILTEVKKQAEDFRNTAGYSDFLKKEILEAVKIIDSEALDILYSALDEKIIGEKFIKETTDLCKAKFNKDFSLKFIKSDFKDMGFIVQSKDGRIIYDNRFLSRIRRAYEDIYMDLLRKL